MESTLAMGRIVHYRLTESDAEQIDRERVTFQHAAVPDLHWNYAEAGEVYPAMVVRAFGDTHANLQVMLDGNDTFWATSRPEGTEPGTWAWPERSTPVDAGDAAPQPETQTPVTPDPVVQPTGA